LTEQKSRSQRKLLSFRIPFADYQLFRDAFKHIGTDLSDYKFFVKLFELIAVRIRGESFDAGRGSFAPILDILREEAEAIVAAQAQPSGDSFSSQGSSLTNSLEFEILSNCPHYQGHDKSVAFCKSRSKQLRRFKGKIPHSVCNTHWLRYQKQWESLSPEEKREKQRQMEEQKFKRRDYRSSQPYSGN
jgi:hypothetical protein